MVWNAVPFPQSFYRNWEKNLQETGFGLLGFEGNIFRKDSYGSLNLNNQLCFFQKDTEKFKASYSSVAMGLANFSFRCPMKELGSAKYFLPL